MRLFVCLMPLILLSACGNSDPDSDFGALLVQQLKAVWVGEVASEGKSGVGEIQSEIEGKMEAQTIQQLVSQAKSMINEVTVLEVAKSMQADKKPVIVDVREPQEFASGHIKGAINVPRGVLEFKADQSNPDSITALHDKSADLVIYCKSGARSALAAQALATLGYQSVVSMAGGIEAWKQASQPVVIE